MKLYSSQGAVSFTIITYLDTRTIEIYLRFVRVTSLRKFHMRSYRSTLFFKFLDSFNRLVLAEVFDFVSTSLTKLMHFGLLLFFLSFSMMSVVLLSTPSMQHSSLFSPVCFITVGVVWWPGLLCFKLLWLHCNDSFRLVPLLVSRPVVYACIICLLICRVSECEKEACLCNLILLHQRTDRHLGFCRMYI